MITPGTQSTSNLLDQLKTIVADTPRHRLHVNPNSATWIAISVQNTGLSPHVQVAEDPQCQDAGKGWIETLTVEQWREKLALVGRRVTVRCARLGELTGELLALDHGEARLDLGGDDIRYLPWITVELAHEELDESVEVVA
jgi:hypothetical protein